MADLRVGVVGVGRLGKRHVHFYNEIAGVKLVGVYDIDEQQGQTVAQDAQTRAFDSYDELLASVDALSIVAPTISHFDLAQRALAARKHIFVEKPITSTTREAARLIELAEQQNRVLQVGHVERFNPAYRALSQFPLSPRFIESHRMASFDPRGTDVAVVLDLMIHDIDIILSFVNSPVARIDANGVAVVSKEPDIANARIQFANGCVANVTASRISQKKMRKMRLFQRDAYVSIDFLQGLSEVFRLAPPGESPEGFSLPVVLGKLEQGETKRHIIYDKLEAPEGDALKMELKSFVAAIKNGTPPLVSGEDGLRALEVAAAITQMIKRQVVAG